MPPLNWHVPIARISAHHRDATPSSATHAEEFINMGHTAARNEVVAPYVSPSSSGLDWRVQDGHLYHYH